MKKKITQISILLLIVALVIAGCTTGNLPQEKKTIEMAQECKEECKFFVQRSLLEYLLADEKKHDLILRELEVFKKT